jgi:hypothetical protein
MVSGLAGLLLTGPLVRDAAAVDLTGTWEGTATCAGVSGNVVTVLPDVPLTLEFTQAGFDFNLNIDLDTTELTGNLNGTHLYEGTLKQNVQSKVGSAKVIQCGTIINGNTFTGAFGHVKARPDNKTKITFIKGDLQSVDGADTAVCIFEDVAQTDTNDPGIGPCP